MRGLDRFAVGGDEDPLAGVAVQERGQEGGGAVEVVVPGLGAWRVGPVGMGGGGSAERGLDRRPWLAVCGAVAWAVQAGLDLQGELKRLGEHFAGLADTAAWGGIQRGDGRAGLVLGAQPDRQAGDLVVTTGGKAGAGHRSADQPGAVAVRFAVSRQQQLPGQGHTKAVSRGRGWTVGRRVCQPWR